MSRVRVLHLITHLGVGGATDNTLLTVRGHCREKYEVHLGAGPVLAEDHYTDWTSRGREYADAFFLVPDLCRPISPRRDLKALMQLTELMRSGGYQIVHAHCAKAGILGRFAARRARVPIIIQTFHCFSWKVNGDSSVTGLRRHKDRLKSMAFIRLERYTASFTDAMITVADVNKEEAVRVGLAPPEKIATVCSGIDIGRFSSGEDRAAVCKDLGLDPDRPIVASVGRLSVQKDPVTFVRAARAVLERRPDAQVLLVGDGPLLDAVQAAVDGETRIRVLGFRDDVPRILCVVDVFVLSSIWEGLGRALTEAMAVGLPVAATAVDGIPELVRQGETGLLCSPRDPAALADNIVWLLEHPEEARRMAALGRARTRPLYTSERMVQGIEAVYERLLAEKALR